MSAAILTLKEGVRRLPGEEIVRQLAEAGYTKRLLINTIYVNEKPTRKYLVIGCNDDISQLLTGVSSGSLDFTIEMYNYGKRQLDQSTNGIQVACDRWKSDKQTKAVAHDHISRLRNIIPEWSNIFSYSAYPTTVILNKDGEHEKVECFKFVIYPRQDCVENFYDMLSLLYDYFSNINFGKVSVHFNKNRENQKVNQ